LVIEILIKLLWSFPIWIAAGILGYLTRVSIDKSIEYFRIDIVFLDWNSYFTALKWVQFSTSIIYVVCIGLWAGIFHTWDALYLFNLLVLGARFLYAVAKENIKHKKVKDEQEMEEITENTIRVMEEKEESILH